MIINHNLNGMNAHRMMSANTSAAAKSMEKLSSGLKINRAGDDAAGLSISEKMKAQIRGLDQASRNSQDGISMIQTAEGALNETHSILQRMKELATQASNGTNTETERKAIQDEVNQLSSEINKIGNTTDFNKQSLLKGKNVPVTSTAQNTTTTTAGVAGVVTGELSALTTDKKSVVGSSSSTSVQGNQAAATGALKDFNVDTASEEGAKSAATLKNGLVFTSKGANATLNGKTIEITTGAGTTTNGFAKNAGTGNYTITIGDQNKYTTQGELYNAVKAAYDTYVTGGGADDLDLAVPTNTATAVDMTKLADTQSLSGGKLETAGVYSFSVDKAFKEVGDTITIGGKTFTAKTTAGGGTINPANGEFDIAVQTTTAQATSLQAALNAVLGSKYSVTNPSNGKIVLTEASGTAKGKDLTGPTTAGAGADDKLNIANAAGKNLGTVTIQKSVANATGAKAKMGPVDVFDITSANVGTDLNGVNVKFGTLTDGTGPLTSSWDAASKTLTVSGQLDDTSGSNTSRSTAMANAIQSGLTSAGFNVGTMTHTAATTGKTTNFTGTLTFGSGAAVIANADTMVVTQNDGNLTINLAGTTASKNTAAKIQAAVQSLGKVQTSKGEVDFSKYQFSTSGNWDTKTIGENIVRNTGTLVGGTEEVKGESTFTVAKMFAVGDVVDIKGQKFTAVANGADPTKGQFDIGADINAQAAGIRAAINGNSVLAAKYTASGTGADIKLTENDATGIDIKATDLAVRATGTAGEYSTKVDNLLESGSKFVIDGTEISVSDKTTHSGYANGTAIKTADTTAAQTAELVNAINTNADLKEKYTASVGQDGSLVLKQNALHENSAAPVIATKNSSEGNFEVKLQIGANAGQSMTVELSDMRSKAIGITGDGSQTTVTAKDGKVASYLAVKGVTDGTSKVGIEYALDVTSSPDNASAAISVLSDAIDAVSEQRSKLGAFQNRLEHTINNLGTSSENLSSAESRIRDTDMAKEMMEYSKNNILTQASQAMLAQAKSQPEQVLQLLR